MSNTNANFEEMEIVGLPEGLPPQTEEQLPVETEAPKPQKTGAARVFAAILAALSVGLIFLPINVIKGAAVESVSLFTLIQDLLKNASEKLFGILPTFVPTATTLGKFATVALYLLALTLVLTVVFGLIGVFAKKSAPALLRAASFFFATGVSVYTVFTLLMGYIQTNAWKLDLVCLGVTAVACLLYFILGVIKVGKKAWVSGLQYVFTAVASVCVFLTLAKDAAAFSTGLGALGLGNAAATVELAIFGLMFVIALLGCIRVHTEKGLVLDLIRYILTVLVAGALCYFYLSSSALMLAIIAAGLAVVQIVICAIQMKIAYKKEEEPVVEEEEPAPVVEEFIREEFAEAVAYEGGPVEGVEIAEEVNPTYIAPPPQVQTAGYDFYNCKSFDPFIAVLNNEERNQFTELFIVKFKGVMPEIPDYVVGGDNKEFFRKLFIYLGQYRDRIPDGLLAKIYQYAIKLS